MKVCWYNKNIILVIYYNSLSYSLFEYVKRFSSSEGSIKVIHRQLKSESGVFEINVQNRREVVCHPLRVEIFK